MKKNTCLRSSLQGFGSTRENFISELKAVLKSSKPVRGVMNELLTQEPP